MIASPSQTLAEFAAGLRYSDIPHEVVLSTENLFLDWYASAVAGCKASPVEVFKNLAESMGPESGPCSLFGSDKTTSPMFAAMVNAAASHVVEQDDLHNQSILHPATVVFPPIFAVAQADPDLSGKDFLTAAVVGYECGIRVGQFLGKSHYRVFHMTATAGTVASAMAVANLLRLSPEQTLHALGSAGTQAGGLWEFLRDAADSKQLHTAKASVDGLIAAYTARDGLTAASRILEGDQGMAAGMMGEGDVNQITDRLGERWATAETSFKFHASCRHTHPAADALLELCHRHEIDYRQIAGIDAYVYQAAEDVLGAVKNPATIHQSKFSMGFVLALIARYRSASVNDFTDEALADPVNRELHDLVKMVVDPDIESRYPDKWSARVLVRMRNGEVYETMMDTPKGDPDNMLSREELETKAMMLAGYSETMNERQMGDIIAKIWRLPEAESFASAFSEAPVSSRAA